MNPLKLILLGVGGYFLYEYLTTGSLLGSSTISGSTGSTVVGEGQTVNQTPSVSNVTAAAKATTYQMLADKASKDAHFIAQNMLGTYPQWCYYYQQIRGIACAFTSKYPTGYLMSLDEFWSDAVKNGLSGLEGGYAFGSYIRQNGWVN